MQQQPIAQPAPLAPSATTTPLATPAQQSGSRLSLLKSKVVNLVDTIMTKVEYQVDQLEAKLRNNPRQPPPQQQQQANVATLPTQQPQANVAIPSTQQPQANVAITPTQQHDRWR